MTPKDTSLPGLASLTYFA